MNNKMGVIAHRALGFREPETYITAICRCRARRQYTRAMAQISL